MPIQPFGKAEAQYDALRVFSQQALEAGPGDGSGAGGLLENKIYLWPADGSTIATYDPTEAGIDAVIAAATATPGTIWLPSIEIACTSQKTVPANTAVKGLSHKSILSFSGFADPALVLSAGSIIQDFTLNHSDGQWFDASAEDSKALRVHGTAQRAIIGTNPLTEVWLAANNDVFWLDRAVNNWHKITPGLGNISNFFINSDSSTAYLHISLGAWYKGTNLKTSPTWTSILSDTSDVSRNGVCDGTDFHTVQHVGDDWQHGIYNGSSWSWGTVYAAAWFAPDCIGKDFDIYYDLVKSTSGSTIETAAADYRDGDTGHGAGWVNTTPTRYAWGVANANGHAVLRVPGGSNVVDAGAAVNTHSCRVRGALNGPHIYAVDHNGILHYSSDGVSFSSIATWETGFVCDTLIAGGGDLVWSPNSVPDGEIPARLYANGVWSYTDLTYNFWSLTSGSKTIHGMGVAYP